MNEAAAYWKKCDVNYLANHFHKYDESKQYQYQRISKVWLDNASLKDLFPADDNLKLNSFAINMALTSKEPKEGQYTFLPYINARISKSDSNTVYEIEKYFLSDQPIPSAKVPAQFKDWLCKNWMEIDASLIDDVFTASFDDDTDIKIVYANKKQGLPIMRNNQRLLSYHFTETSNQTLFKFVNDHKGQMDSFIFHLGVDMNKFAHKEMFSFSPIFEIKLNSKHLDTKNAKEELIKIKKILSSGLRYVLQDDGSGEVYYEYSQPCPSTCGA